MATHPSPHDPYEHVLNDLRKRRDDIDVAIRAIEAVRVGSGGVQGAGLPNATELEVRGNPTSLYFGLSIADASKRLLQERGIPLHSAEIAPVLKLNGVSLTSADPVNTVNSVLNRRSHSVGDIVRTGRSVWGLKEWVDAGGASSAEITTQEKMAEAAESAKRQKFEEVFSE